MPRTKTAVKSRRRRKKVLKAAKGYVGSKHRLYGTALESVRLEKAGVAIDRRILADLAVTDEPAFREIVSKAKQALEKAYGSA
jgi:large subunit ribosomal protein L20